MDQGDSVVTREPLVSALADVFGVALEDIAEDLRKRIADEFFPIPWDRLTAEQRERFAGQIDRKHDPESQALDEYWQQFFERRALLVEDIEAWEAVATPTAGDLAKKTEMLAALRQQLAEMERERSDAAGDTLDGATVARLPVGSAQWRSMNAKAAAEARHNQPGGTREKRDAIRRIWATGKYKTRDQCAEAECSALSISYTTARKALRNMPDP
ncbi:MAG: hypothetical protein EVA65_04230 [Oceanococcus sp.]|nr:MAG: hypothetical protein EVA65_04230 [Oceanococcus sp.]